MFKVTFGAGETVLEQDSLPTDDDCLYMLDTGEVDIVIAGSGEAANTNQEERKVLLCLPLVETHNRIQTHPVLLKQCVFSKQASCKHVQSVLGRQVRVVHEKKREITRLGVITGASRPRGSPRRVVHAAIQAAGPKALAAAGVRLSSSIPFLP